MTTDSDAMAKLREHVEHHKNRGQAYFSIAGMRALLAELDTLKANETAAYQQGAAACIASLEKWRVNLDQRHDSSLIALFDEAVEEMGGIGTEFDPTFEHAEGGLYRLVGPGQVKMTSADEWRAAYFYDNEKGERFATGPERWVNRFKLAVR